MKRLLAPLWYPPEPSFAGGFYRAKRILESVQNWQSFAIASDTFPISLAHERRYPTRWLRSNSAVLFKVMRAVNWAWSTVAIIALGLFWREKFDLVYAGTSEILPISLSAVVIGKILRIPVVLCNLNVRDTEFWALNRLVHQAADAVITISEALAQELRREGLRARVLVATTGVDDFSLPSQPPQYDAVFVGRHTEAKGVFDLFEIWRLVCDVRPGAQLACAGFVPPHLVGRIRRALQLLRLESNVSLLGPISENDKWRLYASSRICVFPSRVEGWGIVPIEALLAGVPVVAYNLGAYESTIAQCPGGGARLVRIGDIAGFAQESLALFSNDETDHDGFRNWAKHFTWAAAALEEERILDSVAALRS